MFWSFALLNYSIGWIHRLSTSVKWELGHWEGKMEPGEVKWRHLGGFIDSEITHTWRPYKRVLIPHNPLLWLSLHCFHFSMRNQIPGYHTKLIKMSYLGRKNIPSIFIPIVIFYMSKEFTRFSNLYSQRSAWCYLSITHFNFLPN